MKLHPPQFWQKGGVWSWVLWPLAVVYRFLVWWHGRQRARKSYQAAVPVISVGNLTVGGTGKTPLALHLAKYLAEQGEKPAILLRGYGGDLGRKKSLNVMREHIAREVGDEAVMLRRALSKTPAQVWVGRNRRISAYEAVKAGATVLILDDGFQYRSIKRDLDLVVVDGAVGFGNGLCLPAGPLREPFVNIKRAHMAVVVNLAAGTKLQLPIPTIQAALQPVMEDILVLRGKPLVAMSGIGRPQKFFDSLRGGGLSVVATFPFPDHHAFTAQDLADVAQAAQRHDAKIVTTAKDHARLPENFAHQAAIVQAELVSLDFDPLHAAVRDAIKRRRAQ